MSNWFFQGKNYPDFQPKKGVIIKLQNNFNGHKCKNFHKILANIDKYKYLCISSTRLY